MHLVNRLFSPAAQHEPRDPDELLRLFAQGRDLPCPSCGYNLRNTTSTRCPECGTTLKLDVNARRIKLGASFWAILAAAGPLGVYLTGLGLVAYSIVHEWTLSNRAYAPSPTDLKVTGILAGASLLYAGLVAAIVRARGWLAARRAMTRRLIVLSWVASLIAIHVFVFRWVIEAID